MTMDELRDRVIEAVWQGRTYLELPDELAAGCTAVSFALPATTGGHPVDLGHHVTFRFAADVEQLADKWPEQAATSTDRLGQGCRVAELRAAVRSLREVERGASS